MMMMNHKGQGAFAVHSWKQEELRAHIQFMKDFAKRLHAQGELLMAEGLAAPDQAKLVKAGPSNEPVVDGVFPETKEFLVGFWLVDVENAQRAYQLAAEASLAPGPGGVPLRLTIEIRQVMSAPSVD